MSGHNKPPTKNSAGGCDSRSWFLELGQFNPQVLECGSCELEDGCHECATPNTPRTTASAVRTFLFSELILLDPFLSATLSIAFLCSATVALAFSALSFWAFRAATVLVSEISFFRAPRLVLSVSSSLTAAFSESVCSFFLAVASASSAALMASSTALLATSLAAAMSLSLSAFLSGSLAIASLAA